MFKDVIDSIEFSDEFEGEEADLGSIKSKIHPFSNSNFNDIKNSNSGSISFVDGGNGEIFKAPNFSLQLCRVAYVTFENGKRIKQERKEFYVLVNVVDKKFVVKTFGEDINLSFDIDDDNFKSGKNRGSVSSVVSAARRFAELKLASSLHSDFVVIDGSLQKTYTFEDKFFDDSKNIVGFCKTCSWLTKSGNSVSALMNLHKGKFAYHPLVELLDENYSAKTCFVRLHEKSKYVFKIDFNKEIDEKAISLLSENSNDPVFLGYPYGLVLADKLARVSNEEVEYLKTKLISEINNEDLLRYLNALNAHDVLDNI